MDKSLDQIYQQSAISQPLGNATRDRRNSRLYLKLDSGLVIADVPPSNLLDPLRFKINR